MKPDLSPYLAFDGCARDALEFYATVLGGKPVIETYGDFRPDVAAENQDLVLYGVLRFIRSSAQSARVHYSRNRRSS